MIFLSYTGNYNAEKRQDYWNIYPAKLTYPPITMKLGKLPHNYSHKVIIIIMTFGTETISHF